MSFNTIFKTGDTVQKNAYEYGDVNKPYRNEQFYVRWVGSGITEVKSIKNGRVCHGRNEIFMPYK